MAEWLKAAVFETASEHSGKCKRNKHNLLPYKHLQPFSISSGFTRFDQF